MQPKEIARRVAAIRLSHKELARRAHCNPNTISRILAARQSPYLNTHNSVIEAVKAEELALLRHLLDLHGLPEGFVPPAGASGAVQGVAA